jgi:hypothetical protein
VRLLHSLAKIQATFDDPNLVSRAGLVPVMALAQHAGLGALAGGHVRITRRCGVNAAAKVGCLVAGMIGGADSIDDLDLLRHGAMPALFGGIRAPSTLGSFLRSFTWGNVLQLGKVNRLLLAELGRRARLLPGKDVLAFVDIDSQQKRVYGHKKQGAGFGHTKIQGKSLLVRGLNALVATVSTPLGAPVIAGTRLRGGTANSARGAASFVAESVPTARAAGCTGTIVVRMDSAFYSAAACGAVRRAGAFFSVTVQMNPHVAAAIASIPEDAWTPIKYPRAIWDDQLRAWVSDALPVLRPHHVQDRIRAGWQADDPLTPVAFGILARQAGATQFHSSWLPALRGPVEATLRAVGTGRSFGQAAACVPAADGRDAVPWTRPLHREEAVSLIMVVRTAVILTLASVTGMRASELMELQVGCRQPPQESGPGLVRYRLASTLVKGQPLGGVRDEWVVIQDAYDAADLAEQLHDDPRDGEPLLGRFHFASRYQRFRDWVNGPDGQRLGLAPIPDGSLTLRMLRRKLAIELAYRPGGLLAAKIYLHHVSAATTEGYASRPGGAQAELLAEVSGHEQRRNLELVLAEFRNYQQGILPVGPGARSLTDFFTSIDGKTGQAAAPKTQRSDRDVLNLLAKRAKVLHLGPANCCWFTDPARALCLKMAGTPDAKQPLIGMCDSARCPQATHHPCHRPVWAEHAERTKTFLGQLGTARMTERTRLQADYDRVARVIAEIDATASAHDEEPA